MSFGRLAVRSVGQNQQRPLQSEGPQTSPPPMALSLFSPRSWLERLLGPQPNVRYIRMTLYLYFFPSFATTIALHQVLHGYKHVGPVLVLWNIGLLIWWSVSLRSVIVTDSAISTRSLPKRVGVALFGALSYVIVLFPLGVEVRQPDLQTELVVSMVSALWVATRIALRSQRRAHASWF